MQSRGEGLGAPREMPPDGVPADIDAELDQFTMDAGRTSERIGKLIWRIKSRISAFVLDRPERRDRHRQ